jgi:hypothetical protein
LLAIDKAISFVSGKLCAAFLTDFFTSASYPSTPEAIASFTIYKE